MCDVDVYVLKNGAEEKIMENVDRVERVGDALRLQNLFGEEKTFPGRIVFYDNTGKKMVIETG